MISAVTGYAERKKTTIRGHCGHAERKKKSSVTAVQSSKRQFETGKRVAAAGLCHLQLPILITYCDKLQSFECPDLLCFSCSRECAWHWVAELQSPSSSTMSPQVIVSASSSVSLVLIVARS